MLNRRISGLQPRGLLSVPRLRSASNGRFSAPHPFPPRQCSVGAYPARSIIRDRQVPTPISFSTRFPRFSPLIPVYPRSPATKISELTFKTEHVNIAAHGIRVDAWNVGTPWGMWGRCGESMHRGDTGLAYAMISNTRTVENRHHSIKVGLCAHLFYGPPPQR